MASSNLNITTPGDREIAMTRVFDAPRSLVFEAWTKPELLARWLGAVRGWSMVICEIDLKVGGAYRYVWRHTDGREMTVRGIYREIVVPERIVNTESFDDPWYSGEAIATLVLTETAGRTTLTHTLRYESRDVRDGVLKSGMEVGVAESYDRLAEILASAPAQPVD